MLLQWLRKTAESFAKSYSRLGERRLCVSNDTRWGVWCWMLHAERETRKMPSILHCIRCILCARHSWAALKRFTVHRIDSQCFFPFFVFVRFRKSILRFPSRFILHSLQHDLWAVRFGIAIAATDQLCQIVFASMEFRVCVWHKICSSMHSIQVENSICFEFFHRIQFRDVFQGPRWH